MNNTIWKFKLNVDDIVVLYMPHGADILTVDIQDDWPCLWAAVDRNTPTEARSFVIHGTGHHIDNYDKKMFVGTFFMSNGLVFHVFEMVDEA